MPAIPLHHNVPYQDGVDRCIYCAKGVADQSSRDEQCGGALPLRAVAESASNGPAADLAKAAQAALDNRP